MTTTSNGRGKFTPVPFTYTFEGKEYTWLGRGRRPATLSALEKATGKVAKRDSTSGQWALVAADTEKVATASA